MKNDDYSRHIYLGIKTNVPPAIKDLQGKFKRRKASLILIDIISIQDSGEFNLHNIIKVQMLKPTLWYDSVSI
jgi:hypothetical protein